MDDLEHLLNLATREDLVVFALNYASENKSLKKELMAFLGRKYIGNKTTKNDYVSQMREAFDSTMNAGNRWHRFDVPDWEQIFNKAAALLREGEKLLDVGNAEAAATIAVEFFKQFSENFDENTILDEYDDMTRGDYECELAEDLLLHAMDHPYLPKDTQQKLVAELKAISKTSFSYDLDNYGIFDFDDMLLQINMKTMSEEDTLQLLDTQIKQHHGQYDQPIYVERKIILLRQMERNADADAVEQDYIALPQIRKKIVDRMVEHSDYDKAIACVNDGIAVAEKEGHCGTVDKWRTCLLEINEKKGDKEKQIEICRTLFKSNQGSKDYYHKLKALVDKNAWTEFLEKLLDEAIKANCLWNTNLADIYVEEKDKENLFCFIKSHSSYSTDMLDSYAIHTGEEHAEALLELYCNLLKRQASGPANVKVYPRIANSMKCMMKLKGGKDATHLLAVFFRERYSRRPSFMASISGF